MSLCTLDHIVLLLSTPEFENLPAWLSDNFTVLIGGTHNNQPSRNKLIVFADGTYIELFNWYDTPPEDDEARPMSSWAHKKPGLIDFALSSLPPSTADSYIGDVNSKLAAGDGGLGVAYKDPTAGGRKTNDGVEIRWKVSRARYSHGANTPDKELFPGGRLDVPFFCHDVTERELRVPFDDAAKTKHACGAKGIHAVEVTVPKDALAAYAEVYSKVTGVAANAGEGKETVEFEMRSPASEAQACKIVLRAADGAEDTEWMRKRGIGISALVVRATDDPGHKQQGDPLGSDEIGSSVRLIK